MMIDRDRFDEVGGFDEDFAVGFQDVDLCLRLMEAGYLNIWTPYVEAVHAEGSTRGSDDIDPQRLERNRIENARLRARWGPYIERDPFHNPNLSRETPFFEIAKGS